MSRQHHGLSLGMVRVDEEFIIVVKAIGKLNHADYQVLSPMIDSALQKVMSSSAKVLVDISEFEGWELRAAWDDFKLGLKHGESFSKIAVYGNNEWRALGIKVSEWFVSGEIKAFDDYEAAMMWLQY
ncbi:STAS/SEC14 domain-containing protein [Psychromonas sp. MME2]|uniref:STAS/SEC14 domain-containing protein n=1 Tax=unclassified Psychromonas TaxID=2614957 RepID=UPI00339BF41C